MATLNNGTPAHTYELHRVPEAEPFRGDQSFNLTSVLQSDSSQSLLRVERLILAYSVACSFLQFFHTPWLPSQCTAKDIHLPISIDTSRVLYRKAYFTCSFGSETAPTPLSDVAFAELAIILLELCFGRTLESHRSWAQFSGFLANVAPERRNSGSEAFVRKATACEWIRDVVYEADVDYYTAVEWCLNRATLKSDNWRLEFAHNVLAPLHTCYSAAMEASGQSV